MSHPAPGTMTPEQARENMAGMAASYGERDLVAAFERALGAVKALGEEAVRNGRRGEKPAADYRLMWTAGVRMRRELLATRAAGQSSPVSESPRTLGTVPADDRPGLGELAALEERAAPGYYAIEGADGMLRFYRLDIPTAGRWAGSVFVKQVTGHVGEEGTRVRHPAKRVEVLAAIEAAGPVEAAQRYGQEIGRCSRCHRVLTNEESRAYGIGPECRAK